PSTRSGDRPRSLGLSTGLVRADAPVAMSTGDTMHTDRHLPRRRALVAAIALTLGFVGTGWTDAARAAAGSAPGTATDATTTEDAPARYTILLREPPLASYTGGIDGFAPPPRIASGRHAGRLDVRSVAAHAWVGHLVERQAA